MNERSLRAAVAAGAGPIPATGSQSERLRAEIAMTAAAIQRTEKPVVAAGAVARLRCPGHRGAGRVPGLDGRGVPRESSPRRRSGASRQRRRTPTAVVEKRQIADAAAVVGSVQPRRRTEVSSQLLARILDVKVRPGETVEPEQELILLDNREVLAQLAEAQAAVTVAEADLLVRKTDFARAGSGRRGSAAGDFARYEGAMKVAEAQVKRAKESVSRLAVQLTYTKILATSRGVVADRFADPGDIAAPGKVLMVIYNPAELELHVNVPESLAPDVRVGQQLKVHIEAAGMNNVAERCARSCRRRSRPAGRCW